MTPDARLAAAIEVIADIEARRRPAPDALKDWGLSHRFAGSGDRAAIAGLVYDVLRKRASAAFRMRAETPRALVLGMLAVARGLAPSAINALCTGIRFAPAPLDATEAAALDAPPTEPPPPWIAGDYPEWLDPALEEAFGAERAAEGAALAGRAPVDVRVNRLVARRPAVMAELEGLKPAATPWSPDGLRILVAPDGKSPAVQAEPAFIKGRIEIQDEGSQLAALFTAAAPGEQVIDLCAGAGGKTLELAALMDNRGQIYATDADKRRLAPIHDRLARASARNVQVRTPRTRDDEPLADLMGKADLVVVDAPCTGVGTWRRNPDAKWRIRPGALGERTAEQAAILERAARFVKPGGRLAYITCSLLPAENTGQIARFLATFPDFTPVAGEALTAVLGPEAAGFRAASLPTATGITLTPRLTGTDGFFVAVLRKAA